MMLCGWGGNCRPGGKYWQPTAGCMTYGHLQADCLYIGISSGTNARCRVWETFTFTFINHVIMNINVVFEPQASYC